MRMADLKTRLYGATCGHRLLTHPFYRAWTEGTLTTADLATYAVQYWRQVQAFPGYLETIAGRLPHGRVRSIVEGNLSDERDVTILASGFGSRRRSVLPRRSAGRGSQKRKRASACARSPRAPRRRPCHSRSR